MDACLNSYLKSSRSPAAATAPSAPPKASSPKRTPGTNCKRTSSKQPRPSSSIVPVRVASASTSSATRSWPSHEAPSGCFRRPPRRLPVPPVQYTKVHQTGSHIILDASEPARHRIAIPDHHPLRLGTFNAILRAVASHTGVSSRSPLLVPPYPLTRRTSATIAGTTSNKSPTIP